MPPTVVELCRDFVSEASEHEVVVLRRHVATLNDLLADQGRRLKEKDRLLAELRDHVAQRDLRIDALERQLADLACALTSKDPATSSTPPSSVPRHARRYPQKPPAAGTKPGRKKGDPGKAPEWDEHPDQVVVHRPVSCPNGHLLGDEPGTCKEARQVRDIVVKVTTTEHQVLEVSCPSCGGKARGQFPRDVPARVAWSQPAKATALLYTQKAFLPTKAAVDLLGALGVKISKGCLDQWRRSLARQLEDLFMPRLRAALVAQPWLGFDETPVNVGGKDLYVHVATNSKLTHYHLGSRSLESAKAAGIVGTFTGTAVTDCYGAYFSAASGIATHQLCCAHLIRELCCVEESFRPEDPKTAHPQPWAGALAEVLQGAIGGKLTRDVAHSAYRGQLEVAFGGLGPPAKDTYRRERDAWNLAVRLRDHEDSVLRFLENDNPPTNNASEQAVKPHKVRQRRSGCFRSAEAAREYLVVQSYLRSAAAHGADPLDALTSALKGHPWLPEIG